MCKLFFQDCKTYGCPEFDPEQNLNIMYEKLKFNKKLIDFSENKVMSMASNSKGNYLNKHLYKLQKYTISQQWCFLLLDLEQN